MFLPFRRGGQHTGMAQQSSTASLSSKLNLSKCLPYNAGHFIMARKSAVEKTVARINKFGGRFR